MRRATRGTAYQALFAAGAIALPALLYVAGYRDVGAILLLSGVLVVVVAIVRSSALSPSWLRRESPRTVRNAARHELVKALVCAGLAVDVLLAMRLIPLPRIGLLVILLVAALLAIGPGSS